MPNPTLTPQRTAKKLSGRARVVTGAAALALLSAGTVGAFSATAASSPGTAQSVSKKTTVAAAEDTHTTSHLTLAAATKAAQAAVDAARKAGQKISVAVVDRNGNTLVHLRGDGAGPQSYESAAQKAFTAVSWNAPTSELVKRLDQAPTLKDIPGTLFLPGGTPVRSQGAPIAGIGVAGAPSGATDEEFAQAGALALGK
ncbi:Syd protein [Streptomyces sp. NBRC 110611]|uniref:GlcG/HbpS family heme-binding protein n=1 Tax=Streptomyces sp. NBRC 110611 TaxID=1621259 RepID=UPI000831ED7F|nr:heme-binding protein [Streptomyces sp. NBRC 110611]GAU70328.1 Syd protein [Streptomyces sp. NBRC 110611]